MNYKSNPMLVFIDFLKLTVCAYLFMLLFAGLVMILLEHIGVQPDDYLVNDIVEIVLWVVLIAITFSISSYFALYRHNIKVEVNNDTIRFLRWKKEYRQFSRNDFMFTARIERFAFLFIPISTSRNLRVIRKSDGKTKNHKCYNFSKGSFEDLVGYIELGQMEQYYKRNEQSR